MSNESNESNSRDSRGGARSGAGRPQGSVSRHTRQSREAIAIFVQQNLPRLDVWLHQVAYGLPKLNIDGEPIRDKEGSVVFVVKPDPNAAIKAVCDIAEYHLPKLSRSEVTVEQVDLPLEQLSTIELQRRLFVQLGLLAEDAVEVVPQPLSADPTSAE